MIKNIRNSVFETNSSSTHSITIKREAYTDYTSITPDSNGVISIYDGEFGWGVDYYNDPETKASYCYTWAKGKRRKMLLLEEVILEHTGAKKVQFVDSGGYIDHQSQDVCEFVFEGGRAILKEFIFNSKCTLIIDSDG